MILNSFNFWFSKVQRRRAPLIRQPEQPAGRQTEVPRKTESVRSDQRVHLQQVDLQVRLLRRHRVRAVLRAVSTSNVGQAQSAAPQPVVLPRRRGQADRRARLNLGHQGDPAAEADQQGAAEQPHQLHDAVQQSQRDRLDNQSLRRRASEHHGSHQGQITQTRSTRTSNEFEIISVVLNSKKWI